MGMKACLGNGLGLGWSNRSGSGKGESGKERRGMVGAGQVTQGFACLAKEPGLCRPKRTNEFLVRGVTYSLLCVTKIALAAVCIRADA